MSLLSLAVAIAPFVVQEGVDRVAGWRSDVDFLVAEAQRVHASPKRPAFSPAFEDAAQALREEVPDLTDDQVLARMMKLVAILNDGHSALYGPGSDSPLELEGRVLPFKFYSFPDGLYVVDGTGEWRDHAGSRVLTFGDVPAEEVLERMSAYRGVDNPMTWTWMGPQFYVRRLSMLGEVGVPIEGGTVEVGLVGLDGLERTIPVPGGDHELVRKLRPFPGATTSPPLYLSNVDRSYWLEPLPEDWAVYFQLNQVRNDPREDLAAFSRRLRETLIEEDATALIVDVRHNNGGNNTLVRPLLRTMIEFELRRPENRIFVLMGRNTFSAAQNFITRIERWTDAVFVGEPSSSSPNFVGEENEIVLPFSRVRGSLSNLYWQESWPWDDRPWIEPDHPVSLTAEDYFAGIDPGLEVILERIHGG